MSRSVRRVAPLSPSSPSTESLRRVSAPSDRIAVLRVATRLSFGLLRSPQHDVVTIKPSATLPGESNDRGRESPEMMTSRASVVGSRRNSMRLTPIQAIFPQTYEERTASGRLRSQGDKRTTFGPRARVAHLHEMIGNEYLSKLRVLFDICDGNSDDKLTLNEVLILFGLMGMSQREANEALAMFGIETTHLLTFDALIKQYRATVVTCAACYTLPRDDFVLRCKRLKHGFQKIDGDRDQGMTRTELEIATQKLHLRFTDNELDRIFAALDRNRDGRVEWHDLVFSAYYNTLASVVETMSIFFTIDMFADLPSFIRQVSGNGLHPTPSDPLQVSLGQRRSSKQLQIMTSPRRKTILHRPSMNLSTGRRESASKSTIERIGFEYLMRTSMKHIAQSKKPVSAVSAVSVASSRFDDDKPRRASMVRTGFSVYVRRRIRWIEGTAVVIAALDGILCGLMSIGFESFVKEDRLTMYYVYIVLINVVVSILEVYGMYVTAVISAFRLTVATNLKLYPLDAEREYLARSIARAALQVGHRKHKLFGIDPLKDSPRLVLWMSFMVYKTKRYVLKLLLKLLIKRVLWRAAAKSVLSLLVLPINGVLNAWTLWNVMLNCRVSIIGPPCIVSLLEAFFLQDDQISPFQRVDYIRILGVALVCKRSIHPNVEIMIEHMRNQWLKPELWPVTHDCRCLDTTDEPCPRHSLDDMDLLLASLKLYAAQAHGSAGVSIARHRRNMFFLLIIALIIDGSVDWIERRLFVRLCNAARLENSWEGVLHLKDDFIAGKGIHMDTVMALIQEIPIEQQDLDDLRMQERVPWRESALYSAQRIAQLLVW